MTVTTNEIQIFNNPAFGQVRTLEIEGIPFFVGKDVALALGYVKPTNAISQHVDNEDSLKQGIPDNQGFIQETTLINESGLYSLVFGSKLSTAKAFKRWITHDVLPTLRKTGSYHIKKTAARRKRTPALTTKVKASLLWIEGVSKTLHLNERTARLKKSAKIFDYFESMCTFALLYILKGGEVRKYCGLFLCPQDKHIRFHAPVSQVNALTAFQVYSNGSVWNRSFISAPFIKQTF